MSNRALENWLDGYAEYTAKTESHRKFHQWAGISAIAAALRKKVKFRLGRLSIYPNLYIVLVAEPGAARKTQALSYMTDLTRKVDSIIYCADSTTRESLIEDLELSKQDHIMLDGTILTHNSMSIVSGEFESFIGQKKDNQKMIVLLTDLFDCADRPWEYKTKNRGKNAINAVYINMIAATTTESLSNALPAAAVGGGLTSRIIFVYATGKTDKWAEPPAPPEILTESLVKDLEVISRITGVYEFSEDCRAKWKEWYEAYDGDSIQRICKDRAFTGWYNRKSTFILKLAQVLTAARTNSLIIEWNIIEEAIRLLETVELDMDKAFIAVGRSELTIDVSNVVALVDRFGIIEERKLMHLVYRDMDAAKFDMVIETAARCGYVLKDLKGGKVFYRSTTNKECQQ